MTLRFGPIAQPLAAALALLLSFGVVNVYFAGAAKLGAALAREQLLPRWLAGGAARGEVPVRSLSLAAVLALMALLTALATRADPGFLVHCVSAAFVVVYALGIAAALKLLPVGSASWWCAFTAAIAVVVLVVMSSWYLIWPLALGLAAIIYSAIRDRRDGFNATA
jgi:amino acid efflux transporter